VGSGMRLHLDSSAALERLLGAPPAIALPCLHGV
jgi:hypothetical protein